MVRRVAVPLAALALAAAGCGDSDDSGSAAEEARTPPAPRTETATAPETEPARTEPRRDGATIKLGDSQFGRVLFDGRGQAIYLFDKERSPRSECYGDCAAAWPPVLTDGEPRAGEGIDEELLGTTTRRGGARQVTYNGHPLYFYAHEGRGEVKCHNVPGFGGLWLVLGADGNALD